MHCDIAYVASYNEYDRELLLGLRTYFAPQGLIVGVVGYCSRYVQELHARDSIPFLNLRYDLLAAQTPLLDVSQIESLVGEPFCRVIFAEGQYYRAQRTHLEARARRVFTAAMLLSQTTRFRLIVHKLGAEIVRRAMLAYADATGTPSCYLGSFPTLVSGRSYYHRSLTSERDHAPPPIARRRGADEPVADWITNARNRHGVITYPSGGQRNIAEAGRMFMALARHAEWDFLSDIIRRRLIIARHALRSLVGSLFAARGVPTAPYFFFPLHVFDDSQITVRNPQFFDQFWIIEYLNRCLPHGYKLVVKLHPGREGAVPLAFLYRIKRLANVVLLRGDVRASEVIRHSSGVIVINSTVALESLLLGKAVLILGNWAFGRAGITQHCDDLSALGQALLKLKVSTVEPNLVDGTLTAFADEMRGGNYYQHPHDWDAIGRSLQAIMNQTP